MQTFVIGSRGSQLARWQANYIAVRLKYMGIGVRIQTICTTGDHMQTAAVAGPTGKGLFTKEIEEALLRGRIDLAVHSLKDLPTEATDGLAVAAIPERDSPFDALVGGTLKTLPQEARVGTGSLRRAAQLKRLRPDLNIEQLRGNVDTRLRRQKNGDFEAIMLAAAGLRRLGMEHEIAEVFAPEDVCPAPGQGALAIETRADDTVFKACRALNHAATEDAVMCERTVLSVLGGGCQLPVGAFAQRVDGKLQAMAVVVAADGSHMLRETAEHSDPIELGHKLAQQLIEAGALELLPQGVFEGE